MNEKKPYYAFFPYLRTSEPVRIRGVVLRGPGHLEGLSEKMKEAVAVLGGAFCLHDGSPINDIVFAVGETSGDPKEEAQAEEQLRQVQLLLAYAHTSPGRRSEPWLSAEHASIFLFREEQMVPRMLVWPGEKRGEDNVSPRDTTDWFEQGYKGIRDWTTLLWFTKGFKIYPEFPHFYLNVFQNLAVILNEYLSMPQIWGIQRLYGGHDQLDPSTIERVFQAMHWYVASCRFAADEAEKLLFLALALEALLRVREGDGLTDRFKDAVITLLGPIPRLDSWLEQFYRERSKLVHEGRPHRLVFFAADKQDYKDLLKGKIVPPIHGMLVDYGLLVFRLCMNAVVSGSVMAADAGLAQLFVTDSERFTGICKILSSKDTTPAEQLTAAAKEVRRLDGEVKPRGPDPQATIPLDKLWSVCRMMLDATLEAVPDLAPSVIVILREAIKHAKEVSVAQCERLEALRSLLRDDKTRRNVDTANALSGLICYLDYLLSPGLKLRVFLEERQVANQP